MTTNTTTLEDILKRVDDDAATPSPYSKNPLNDIMGDDTDDDEIE